MQEFGIVLQDSKGDYIFADLLFAAGPKGALRKARKSVGSKCQGGEWGVFTFRGYDSRRERFFGLDSYSTHFDVYDNETYF